MSAAIADAATPYVIKFQSLGEWSVAPEAAEAGLIGGVAARIEGGKFTDGFSVAAAGYLFNAWAHVHSPPAGAVCYTASNGQPFYAPAGTDWSVVYSTGQSDASTLDNLYAIGDTAAGAPLVDAYLTDRAVGTGGLFDYQRDYATNTFYNVYTDASNFAVGVYGAGGRGWSPDELISTGDTFYYASGSTSNLNVLHTWWTMGWNAATHNSFPVGSQTTQR